MNDGPDTGQLRTLDTAPLLKGRAGVEPILEAFLASALDSAHSRRAYGRHIRAAFRLWAGVSLEEISGSHLAAFRAHVLEGGAVASQAQALAAVRAFFLWVASLGGLSRLTADQVRQLLKGPRGKASGLLSILSPDEARRLVDVADTPRNRAMALVMLGGGLRAAEACSLDGRDLGQDAEGEPLLRIHGKGRKERLVAALVLRAGVAKAISPHCLRHTYATHVLKKGGNIVGLARLLGHASVATTQRYADHLELSELRDLVPPIGW